MSEARRSGIRKALRAGVEIVRSTDYAAFWKILSENLVDAPRCCAAFHSLEEITALARMYSDRIALHAAMLQGRMLGAAVVYVTDRVVHTQYISASPLGKSLGAIDLFLSIPLSATLTVARPTFDFGGSTEQMGHMLNGGLIFQKEGFGARAVCYDTYSLAL